MKKLCYHVVFLAMMISCKQADKQTDKKSSLAKGSMVGCAPQITDKAWYSAGTKAPKLKGLEGIEFEVSTNNKEAQAYFNQGMMFYAFVGVFPCLVRRLHQQTIFYVDQSITCVSHPKLSFPV